VAGACFAESGSDVVCVDVDEKKLERLRSGQVPFFEPGLEAMLARNWPARLDFTTDLDQALRGADAAFIAVGTPPNDDGSADLSAVLAVAGAIAKCAPEKLVVVLKSTVPVVTNARVSEVFAGAGRMDVAVACNPEFL
jgi:UDPglucose 6-dehydrogenase